MDPEKLAQVLTKLNDNQASQTQALLNIITELIEYVEKLDVRVLKLERVLEKLLELTQRTVEKN